MHLFLVVTAFAILWGCPGWAGETPTAQGWYQRGVEFERQQVFGEAVKMFTEAIDSDKQFAAAYFRRGMASLGLQKSNAGEALADFNRAVGLDPKNAEMYYQRGLLNQYLLNNESAREDMETAAALGHRSAKDWLEASKVRTVKQTVAAPAAAPQWVQVEATPKREAEAEPGLFNLAEFLPSHSEPVLHFDIDKADIQEQDYALLDEIAMVLKEQLPAALVSLAGHADSTGTEKHNEALSLARAKAVESYLREQHRIAAQRLVVRGFGESVPVATNATEEGRAKNRRVEILDARK
jgi:outer membrane protein OmpA-like peptidoglycan-associated protein